MCFSSQNVKPNCNRAASMKTQEQAVKVTHTVASDPTWVNASVALHNNLQCRKLYDLQILLKLSIMLKQYKKDD